MPNSMQDQLGNDHAARGWSGKSRAGLVLVGFLAIAGALLFTCNGRGSHLFGTPDHDIQTVRRSIGRLPVAGMFCAGELGPVGGRNFLHGFTASLALFVAPGPPD